MRETRDETLNGENLGAAAWKIYSRKHNDDGDGSQGSDDPTLSARRMKVFLDHLFPALQDVYGPVYYARLVQLLLTMVASQVRLACLPNPSQHAADLPSPPPLVNFRFTAVLVLVLLCLLVCVLVSKKSVEVHIPATPTTAGDAAWATEGEAVSAEQFQRWFTRPQVTMLMGLWFAYVLNGDGPAADGTVAEIGATPSR